MEFDGGALSGYGLEAVANCLSLVLVLVVGLGLGGVGDVDGSVVGLFEGVGQGDLVFEGLLEGALLRGVGAVHGF